MKRAAALLLAVLLLVAAAARGEVAVPSLTQRVTDLTATLDPSQVQALAAKLTALETAKGAQLAILLVPTTQPETVEQYALRVAEAWRLGRKGVDDGILLLVAKEDRKLRIEVGYGLEGALNDATAKRIISEIITPAFQQGDFYGGLDAGVEAISRVVQGEPLPSPNKQVASDNGDTLGNLLGIGLVIFFMGNLVLRQLIGRLPSGLVVGALVGGVAWLMLASLFAALVIGLIAFLLSLGFGSHALVSHGGLGGGGWHGGGSDWGGGGGSFGGGGASGSW
ncbi:MAG: YgcG family protein [Sideroxydans sp.]